MSILERKAGIYIHIPYCRKACHYCNFHFSTTLKSKDQLLSCMIDEIRHHAPMWQAYQFQSIYFGGGTPSLLSQKELSSVLNAVHKNYRIIEDPEITIECNPEDISSESLKYWAEAGINRLSVGIQSFDQDDLTFMNRNHSAVQSIKALELVKDSTFANVNVDLMFGLIDRTLEDWNKNLEVISAFAFPHLSIYNLTIEEQTVFANWKLKNRIQESSSKLQKQQFMLAHNFLSEAGYDHYEVSNYCKDQQFAKHNTSYWNRHPYLGIGPSAHSFDGRKRSWNVANNNKYIRQWREGDYQKTEEIINQEDLYHELIMLGLRTKWGVSISLIDKLPDRIKYHFHQAIQPLLDKKVLFKKADHLILDNREWYRSDYFISELFMPGND